MEWNTERGLRVARVVMFAQAAASIAIWVVQLLTIAGRLDHNQEVPGSVWLVAVANPVIAVLVGVAAVFLCTRAWARVLGVVMECIGIVGALISVLTGFYQALAAMAVAIVVIALIHRYRVRSVADAGSHRSVRQPPEGPVTFRLRLGVAAVALVASGCSSPEPMVCQGGFCSGPAYSPSTGQQVENGVVAVASVIGLVPIVPRSAAGPARRTTGPFSGS
ncbi:hypothetical protein [Actinophytocola algeriensis]|uniref:Fumarate reductase subunit C n=1 Tax=Actinophytocola algeriensis TaxID=1768010 RepID=A0A7W7PZ56_9PSEU|nr:hypothetical protein [Actinophytocola algeriensis]MBB4904011.1 fumarate reductase subunit C [Actinophytocola algeriensis]MBE1477132.1 fumarate reductase subunit C [Actinophytocola algeriensis]